jgi:hypothetical protein
MPDDLKNRGEQDRLRIKVHEEHEELERAIKDVGVMAADVR